MEIGWSLPMLKTSPVAVLGTLHQFDNRPTHILDMGKAPHLRPIVVDHRLFSGQGPLHQPRQDHPVLARLAGSHHVEKTANHDR